MSLLDFRLDFSKQPLHVFYDCLSQLFFTAKCFSILFFQEKILTSKNFVTPKAERGKNSFCSWKSMVLFIKKRSQHFSQKPITRVICHFFFANLNVICSICFLKSQQYCSNGVKNSTRLWIDSMIQYNSYKANGCICHIEVLIKIFNL